MKNTAARFVRGCVVASNGIVHLRYRALSSLNTEWTLCGIEYTPHPYRTPERFRASAGFVVSSMRRTKRSPTCIQCVRRVGAT